MKTLNKKKLVTAISMIIASTATFTQDKVFAQEMMENTAVNNDENDNIEEEVIVTGIRASLTKSMDFKRESSGVVDVITSEEMGKFPDTNLAESLQRITGVAISRSNGEGSQITVRGFGPDFNLITLNGRQMPGTGNSRSYQLENLSSEGVSALVVHKTALAEYPSGGVGSIVNIKTTKPLDSPGLKYSVSGKGIYDTSNVKGQDVTPELAAVFSNTFADDTIGVSLSLSHQQRDFQQQSAAIDGWKAFNRNDPDEVRNLGSATGINAVDNRPVDAEGNPTVNFFLPQNLGYSISDFQRTRNNGQLTLQYSPNENLTTTLDYTTTEATTASESLSFGVWFNFGQDINAYELDEKGTAIKFNESNNDFAHTARKNTTRVVAESIGLNIDWQARDDLHFNIDYHDSSNEQDFGADKGSNANPFVIIGPNNLDSKTYDYTTGDIPQVELFWEDGAKEANPNDFDPLFARFDTGGGISEVKQLQIHGEWTTDTTLPIQLVKFGLARTDQSISGFGAGVDQQGPAGYNGNQAIFPDSMFTRNDTGDFLDQFNGGGSNLTTDYYYTYDFDEAISRMDAFFDGFETDPYATGGIDSFGEVNEVTNSLYAQTYSEFDLWEKPALLNVGLRYETTNVTSHVQQRLEEGLVWLSQSEWNLQKSGAEGLFVSEGEYSLLLPSIDFKVDITNDFVTRASLGKSITRAPLGDLAGLRVLSDNPKPGARSGASGDTNLKPFESENFDLSFEYYYAESSYISAGYFRKKVNNFIENKITSITVEGLRDPLIGPRAIQAEADILARGDTVTAGSIFDQIIANGGGTTTSNGVQQILQNDDDPLVVWDVNQPSNGDTKTAFGYEFAIQHLFGETGFGTAFNFTLVDTDVDYDPNLVQGIDVESIQTPLPGLSDSYNWQGFYEKYGLSVKFTYAWRDSYLIGLGQAQGSSDNPPQFAKEFGQWDVSINYDITDELTVFLEGININNETEQVYGRYEEQFLSARQYGNRYLLGARYSF